MVRQALLSALKSFRSGQRSKPSHVIAQLISRRGRECRHLSEQVAQVSSKTRGWSAAHTGAGLSLLRQLWLAQCQNHLYPSKSGFLPQPADIALFSCPDILFSLLLSP